MDNNFWRQEGPHGTPFRIAAANNARPSQGPAAVPILDTTTVPGSGTVEATLDDKE